MKKWFNNRFVSYLIMILAIYLASRIILETVMFIDTLVK